MSKVIKKKKSPNPKTRRKEYFNLIKHSVSKNSLTLKSKIFNPNSIEISFLINQKSEVRR